MRAIECVKKGYSYQQYLSVSTDTKIKQEVDYNNLTSRFINLQENTAKAVEKKASSKAERIKNHQNAIRIKEEKLRKDNENKQLKDSLILEKIRTQQPSINRFDYVINDNDYKRGNKIENEYKKLYTLTVLKAFNCQCANCFDMYNGYELDHFIFSKNEGGNFVMRTNDGYLVNNAIILCIKCNRAKQDKKFTEFFKIDAIARIHNINKVISEIINQERKMDKYFIN
ncbi:hypothetical protein [Photobacterium sp. GB-210]|uniref:hypothetical protein n=1 Tax=Photobacterium sp. GB-210 TaxID=2022104 RepID=UPI000D175D44|nr:hypothetical protein [Photobacterium sp. GB-210]PSV40982.1 hypothetical protein C9J38_02795 [Photobacterium sp. GB-210]